MIRQGARAPGILASALLALLVACAPAEPRPSDTDLHGRVAAEGGEGVAGALVTAVGHSGVRVTVFTDGDGEFRLPRPVSGVEVVEVRDPEGARTRSWSGPDIPGVLVLESDAVERLPPPGSAWLDLLPESEEKRYFVLNCTACHVWDERWSRGISGERSRAEWLAATARMVDNFGPHTGFPVISGGVEPERLGEWLHRHFGAADGPAPVESPGAGRAASRHPPGGSPRPHRTGSDRPPSAVLHEYPVPEPGDLPHDLAVDPEGRVVITGMLTHRMYVLEPESGAMEVVPIPREAANPRALDIDDEGDWWVVLGAPGEIARFQAASGVWTFHPVGTYAHSVMLGGDGRIWYNGHFSRDPEIVASLDPATEETREYVVPRASDSEVPADETTIPYGLRVAPDGTVWGTQLAGGKLVRVDPADGSVRQWSLPTASAGPRRLDVGPDGMVWIPEYGAGRLARFDPSVEEFREWDLPLDDALPYVVRVDPRRGTVWIGTGHGDAILSFDPRRESFTVYPLPVRGALVRHLDVDPETGDVWAAYGAWPGIPPRVLRLSPGEG